MIAKTCLALALAGAPFAMPASDPVYVQMDEVRQVMCDTSRGTAFRTGQGAFTSVNHVVDDLGCTIDGEPIQVTLTDAADDFASLRTKVFGKALRINCNGFVEGEEYVAVGYASGLPVQRAIRVTSSYAWTIAAPWGGFHVLVGQERFIPGMSGGPVLNKQGEVVGTVNGYNRYIPLSYSQPLSETALCGA